MGKKSREKAAQRAAAQPAHTGADQVIEPVAPRQPCPCGSGRRYRLCHGVGRPNERASSRTFEGFPAEIEWVAMREILPAATVELPLKSDVAKASGVKTVTVATVLPNGWPAMHRNDGKRFVAVQMSQPVSDVTGSMGRALNAALSANVGNAIESVPSDGPDLRDLLDLDAPFSMTLHESFDFWIDPSVERTAAVKDSLDQAAHSMVPVQRVAEVPGAYWTVLGERTQIRWVLPDAEEPTLDSFARLQVKGELVLCEGAKFLGTFRAHGFLVPVWDIPADATADSMRDHITQFQARLAAALAQSDDLSALERQARAGIASRQITLR